MPTDHATHQHGQSEGRDSSSSANPLSPAQHVNIQRVMDTRGPEAESSGDETSALACRLKGGRRSYNTTSEATASRASVRADSTGTQDAQGIVPLAGAEISQPARQVATQNTEPRLSWWKQVVENYGTIELENKGSVARDHLALERTFLAWLRTSLSFASIGIAITQLFRLNQTLSNPDGGPKRSELRHVGKPIGVTFIGVGILILIIGFHRYFESQHYVRLGKFPASRASVALVSFVAGALILASLIVIVLIKPAIVT